MVYLAQADEAAAMVVQQTIALAPANNVASKKQRPTSGQEVTASKLRASTIWD